MIFRRRRRSIARVERFRPNLIIGAVLFIVSAAARAADAPPPVFSAALRETFDAWAVPTGMRTGTVALNKLQLSATLDGTRAGLAGWSIHAQVFRTDGESLSARLGDIQTSDNIEALPVTRLFEAWVQKSFGTGDRTLSFRVGLLDYNADFDSTETASLFVNSSHGIGPDISKSGRNGPSIFPVSALGARFAWLPSKRWTVRAGVYDGVAGDPAHPRRFATARLARSDGALIAAQVDYQLSEGARIEAGIWHYTATTVFALDPARAAHAQGFYTSVDGALMPGDRLRGWLRAGVADGRVQPVRSYIGGGLVLQPWTSRPDDRIGLSIASAEVSDAGTMSTDRRGAETTVEATYQLKVSERLALQPDLQYVHWPSGNPSALDALAIGLRVVLTAGFPRPAPATQASDPTVPPEGPKPPDQPSPGASQGPN